MKLFFWNKNFETGIESIDTQHKILVGILNKLGNAIATCQELPKINQLLDELFQYTRVHFGDEEALMHSSNMPIEQQIKHKQQHSKFIQQLANIKLKSAQYTEHSTQELLEFLTTWLISHILGSDTEVARYCNQQNPIEKKSNKEHQLEISNIEHTLLQALNESERRFRFLTDHTPAIIWASDASGNRIFFNASWYNFVGKQVDNWLDCIHSDDRTKYAAFISEQHAHKISGSIEYRLRNEKGNYHYFLEKIIPRIQDDNTFYGFISSAIDITQLKNAERALMQSKEELEQEVERRTAEINKLVVTDTLTGLGNRRYFNRWYGNKLSAAQRYDIPLTVIYIDIDHFKRINDSYGHDVGDSVLIAVAKLLKGIFRDCDILARYGGEEFVALLQNTDQKGAVLVSKRILEQCQSLTAAKVNWPLTVSIGIAQVRQNESQEELLARADKAMYSSKNNGRNQLTIAEA